MFPHGLRTIMGEHVLNQGEVEHAVALYSDEVVVNAGPFEFMKGRPYRVMFVDNVAPEQ
jgi:hypothetical protein